MTTRRALLRVLGLLSTGLLAGCSALDSDPKPGSVLVVNNSPRAYTLRIDVEGDGETRREELSIGAAEWGLRNGLLTEPGSYEVTVTLVGEGESGRDGSGAEATGERNETGGTGETATATVEVTEGRDGLAGENLEVFVDEDGGLRVVARRYG